MILSTFLNHFAISLIITFLGKKTFSIDLICNNDIDLPRINSYIFISMSSHISAKVPVFLSLQTKGKNANKDNDCMDILTSNRDISKKN